jgi:glycerol kinase
MHADRSQLTLVIDQGTHATRTCLLDHRGTVVATARQEVGLTRRAGEVEQDATEILSSVRETLGYTLRKGGNAIAQAALATQRSTVLAWDRVTGEALAPALSWQDTRAAETIAALGEHAEQVRERTGLRLSAHYGAGKLAWLLQHEPALRRAADKGRLALGPLATFLLFHLLEGRPLLVDHANASRTLLWNLHSRDWDEWLLRLFSLDREHLPRPCPIRHHYGRLAGTRIPLRAVNGDQGAALFADGPAQPETAYINMGTGAFILVPTGSRIVRQPGLLSGIADSDNGNALYCLEGTVNGAGAALAWAERQWGLVIAHESLDDWLARVEDPPLFLNAVGGLGSPWWTSGAAPHFILELAVPCDERPAPCVTGVLESIAFLIVVNLASMGEAGLSVRRLRASGGLSRVDGLCQRLADLSGRPVERPRESEATVRGAAWLTRRATATGAAGPLDRFSPARNDRLAARYQAFRSEMQRYARP